MRVLRSRTTGHSSVYLNLCQADWKGCVVALSAAENYSKIKLVLFPVNSQEGHSCIHFLWFCCNYFNSSLEPMSLSGSILVPKPRDVVSSWICPLTTRCLFILELIKMIWMIQHHTLKWAAWGALSLIIIHTVWESSSTNHQSLRCLRLIHIIYNLNGL